MESKNRSTTITTPSSKISRLSSKLNTKKSSSWKKSFGPWSLALSGPYLVIATNFFHHSTICQRHHNKIWCLKDSTGNWTNATSDIKSLIRSHFNTLYTSNMTSAPLYPPSLTFPISLSQDIQNTINTEVINHNIKCAMFSFKPHKAPSLDKFHPSFSKDTGSLSAYQSFPT